MNELQDKVAIVTGATSGIGLCIAKTLAIHGAKLAICGRSQERLAKLEHEWIGKHHPFTRAFCLSSEKAIIEFVDGVESSVGPIDILINCAGVNSARSGVGELKIEDLDWMLAVNLRAPTIFMREAFLRMRERKSGHVVNIISTAALFSNEGIGAYTASKAGLDAMTKVFRKEARKFGIAVTAVYPGGVNTEFRAEPNPAYMPPETVANAVLDLLKLQNGNVHELVIRPMVESNFS